jgi:splicing factor 3B subunit 4
VGGLDEKVSESVLWELFVQAGPVVSVNMPKDRVTGTHQGFGFIEFMAEEDADYAIKIMNMIKLFGKPIKVNKASANEKSIDVGANLFVGNLDAEVDEKLLFDTFSAFGMVLQVSYFRSKRRPLGFEFRFPKLCVIRNLAIPKALHLLISRPSRLPTWH